MQWTNYVTILPGKNKIPKQPVKPVNNWLAFFKTCCRQAVVDAKCQKFMPPNWSTNRDSEHEWIKTT